jgi:hypothetical protein
MSSCVLNHVCVRCGGQVDVTGRTTLGTNVPCHSTSTESSVSIENTQNYRDFVARETPTRRSVDASRLINSCLTHTRPTSGDNGCSHLDNRLPEDCDVGRSLTHLGTPHALLEPISNVLYDQLSVDQHSLEPGEQRGALPLQRHTVVPLSPNQASDSASPSTATRLTGERYVAGAPNSGMPPPDSPLGGNLTFGQNGNQSSVPIILASLHSQNAEPAVVTCESRSDTSGNGLNHDLIRFCHMISHRECVCSVSWTR